MADATLRDVPIQSPDQCRLGLADYAEVLYDFMRSCETPITIGVQGDWGIGKTSLLRMIQAKLEDGRGGVYPYVDFNTWQYSLFGQEQVLAISCIRSLVRQIAELEPASDESIKDKAGKAAGRAMKVAGAVLGSLSVGVGGVSVSAKDVKSELSEDGGQQDIAQLMVSFKEDFAELVEAVISAANTDRIVIFIDDLDRVKPVRALELLETLKNFLDVPGCIFVLAVDYDVVQMGMKEKLGENLQQSSGKSFFDKIINVPFTMPTTSYRLGDYITQLLRESGFMTSGLNKPDVKAFFSDITTVTVGRNPRNIKRVVNYAKLLDQIRSKGQSEYNRRHSVVQKRSHKDMQILYALMCMQIAWPELFQYFADNPTAGTVKNLENWEFLENLPEGRKVIRRAADPQQIKSDIGAFVDELFRLLDDDPEDGEISSREMKPVLQIMRFAKLTTATTAKTPLEQYQEQVKNNGGQKEARFLEKAFRRSLWGSRGDCEYRKSGSRYWSIVMRRKQLGSLVTLKSKGHLIFRLKAQRQELLRRIRNQLDQEGVTNRSVYEQFETMVRPLENNSLTGFGETVVDTDALADMKHRRAIAYLDMIYNAAEAAQFDHGSMLKMQPVQPRNAESQREEPRESDGLSEASAALMD